MSLWLRQSESFRKATTWLVLLTLTFCTLPIPIAKLAAPKGESAVPYPCENCPCGCDGPEQCWTNCCCMTPTQRLEWAKKRGVTPPSYAVLQDSNSSNRSCCKTSSKSCCNAKTGASAKGKADNVNCTSSDRKTCCSKCNIASQTTTRSCCSKKESQCGESADAERGSTTSGGESKSKVVLSLFAAKCNGFTFGVSQLPIFVIPKPPIRFATCERITIHHEIVDDFFENLTREVPTPPPRRS